MLQLQSIRKSYTTGDFTQVALDNVSISFRDNEFVAILGPSGSGKTTLLNIIGGLDHYDSGNMVIDGISTEEYKDRDWDTFRNNRVGFVFQSYNLIPHQTVLSNVELALTLSGVSRDERRKRATEALAKVGLAEHVNKKPSQLSGGQMQRVAIARALINDPEILLADEPTGALDSKTSVQIMDLLTEIADDRLVIMVTHNPELAEAYATRIVNLSDGHITSDSDPLNPNVEDMKMSEKKIRRTSMSFFTALALSFNNLMTKKGRTIMTAFAGSIGIIGIAAILALANGVNAYIKNVEEETLSEYPLQIMSSGFDMSSLILGMTGGDADDSSDESASDNGSTAEGSDTTTANGQTDGEGYAVSGEGNVRIAEMVSSMFTSVGANDLESLKAFFDSGESGIEPYVNAIEYEYNVSPQIFSADIDNLRQVNPDKSLAPLGLGSGNSTNSLMSMTFSTDVFSQMPADPNLYQNQYDIMAGRWPENYNELVLVTSPSGRISDFMLYSMGISDPEELDEMVRQFAAEEDVDVPKPVTEVPYEDIIGIKFKLVNASDYYTYDEDYKVWVDKSDDNAFMRDLVSKGEDLEIVGIVKPNPDATATMLTGGLGYLASLTDHVIEEAAKSQIVKDQLDEPGVNVFTGRKFGEEEPDNEFDMQSLFTINSDALQAAFTIDESKLAVDMSQSLDFSDMGGDLPEVPAPDLTPIFEEMGNETATGVATLMAQVMQGYYEYLRQSLSGTIPDIPNIPGGGTTPDTSDQPDNPDTPTPPAGGDTPGDGDSGDTGDTGDTGNTGGGGQGETDNGNGNADSINGTALTTGLEAQDTVDPGTPEQPDQPQQPSNPPADQPGLPQLLTPQQYLQLPQVQAQIAQGLANITNPGNASEKLSQAMQQYVETTLTMYMNAMTTTLQSRISTALNDALSEIGANMASAVSIDSDAFANAFEANMTEEDVAALLASLMTTETATYDNNLASLGYADKNNPSEISIYPIDFNAKASVIEILDNYNDRMESEGQDEKVISYTDIVGTLMASVTEIVNMISTMLIAFVAISLIVSSIMIGVITYISVLERKKEIGILRAIGASKLNISEVFNAETVIEGFVAGLLGVVITALGCIPANIIVYNIFDVPNIAQLPLGAAAILVLISVALTFLAGLIPASSASRKDPVEALRSE